MISIKPKSIKEEVTRNNNDIKRNVEGLEVAHEVFETILSLTKEPSGTLAMLTLDTKNQFLGASFEAYENNINSNIVQLKKGLEEALSLNGKSIVVAHKFPPGDPLYPSSEDIEIARNIYEAAAMIGLVLLDYIVFGDNVYVSFKKEGLI